MARDGAVASRRWRSTLSLFTHMGCHSLIFESNGGNDALNTGKRETRRDETRRETGGSAVDGREQDGARVAKDGVWQSGVGAQTSGEGAGHELLIDACTRVVTFKTAGYTPDGRSTFN